MNPYALHSLAACWSLTASRAALTLQVEREAAERRAEAVTVAAASCLQAWRPMIGRGSGGHGDPSAQAAVGTLAPEVRPGRWAKLATRTDETLTWLADMLRASGDGPALDRIRHTIPRLLPGTARELYRWLTEADERIRDALGLDPDEEPLPGAPACPVCQVRMLRLQTSAPGRALWTVICGNNCLCTGTGCRCGMPGAVEGAQHIWSFTQRTA